MKEFLKVNDDVLYEVVKEFGRDKKGFDEDVAAVTQWMKEQPHLPELLDKRTVANFLILNKCSVEKTKQRIDLYFTLRSKWDDVFGESNPSSPTMRENNKIMYYVAQPKTFNHNRLMFFQFRDPALVEKLEPINILRHLVNVQEMRMKEDVAYGEYFIVDCRNTPLSFCFKITPTFVYRAFVIIYEKLYSCRMKGAFFVNFPKFAEPALNLAKRLMKPKLAERIQVVSDFETLIEKFGAELIPRDFGGSGPSIEEMQEMLEAKFDQYQKWFDHLDTLKVDESQRPEELKNDDILGFYGNFKKLDVD